MCYDRTSTGRKPLCATVCPSGALFYGGREEVERLRKRSRPVDEFQFGRQTVRTKVSMMVPRQAAAGPIDVTAAMHEPPTGRTIALNVLAPEA
jgi:Fe-S-cluster-containing dehydrogenase component